MPDRGGEGGRGGGVRGQGWAQSPSCTHKVCGSCVSLLGGETEEEWMEVAYVFVSLCLEISEVCDIWFFSWAPMLTRQIPFKSPPDPFFSLSLFPRGHGCHWLKITKELQFFYLGARSKDVIVQAVLKVLLSCHPCDEKNSQ